MTFAERDAIVREPIDVRAIEDAVRSDACGGIVTFLGVVRERAQDESAVTGLSYEAHEVMALEVFASIQSELRERFPHLRLRIAHRVGDLRVGDVAVAVCAAAPHRAEAFDACEYAIDQLKARAPIWKKEHYTDAASEWIEN
jgi:molybdopterin synthase catalytic subunit